MNDDAEGEVLGASEDAAKSLTAGGEHRTLRTATYSAMEKTVRSFGSNGLHDSFARVPISVAVDPVALITTECITVTSAMRKHARWAHSSVSAILGGGSNTPNPLSQGSRPSTPREEVVNRKVHKSRPSWAEGNQDEGLANRWGLRGKKGKSMQDNPLMAGFGRLRRELVGCRGIIPSPTTLIANAHNPFSRYTCFRCPLTPTPIPSSHTSLRNISSNNLPSNSRHNKILFLQSNQPRISQAFICYAITICCDHTLPVRSE